MWELEPVMPVIHYVNVLTKWWLSPKIAWSLIYNTQDDFVGSHNFFHLTETSSGQDLMYISGFLGPDDFKLYWQVF